MENLQKEVTEIFEITALGVLQAQLLKEGPNKMPQVSL